MNLPADMHFDGWTLRRSTGELLKDGVRIRLQGQPLRILEELLARPGELVTRDELIASLWPKGVVDFDTALNSSVRRLRTALGDHAGTPRYIETIPRRGYRFIGRVEPPPVARTHRVEIPAGTYAIASRRRWWPAVAASFLLCSAVVVVGAATWLGPGPGARATRAPANPQAQDRFERARHFLLRRAPGDLELARDYFGQALDLDPALAGAWAGLSSVHWLATVQDQVPLEEGLSRTRDAAERALALDPNLAEAHVRLANVRWRSGDSRGGEEHLRRALEIEPENPLALSFAAAKAAGLGRLDDAIALQRRSVAADPLSVTNRHNLAVWLYLAGRVDEARDEILRVRELSPSARDVDDILGLTLVVQGRLVEAMDVAARWSNDPNHLQTLALAYHGLGRQADSDSALRALIESPQPVDPVRVAEIHAYRGEADRAFEWLQAASDTPVEVRCARISCWPLDMVPYSPLLRRLHSDARWEAWAESARNSAGARATVRRKD